MNYLRGSAFAALFVFVAMAPSVFGQKTGVKEVLEGHLASLGSAEARATVKNRIGVGEASVRFVTGKTPTANGRVVMANEGEKVFLGMTFNTNDYPQEAFSFNGKNVNVAAVRVGTRSVLGNFLVSNGALIKESLLGGALFSSWGPAHSDTSKAKIKFDGTKKLDGGEAYVLSYSTKGGGDITVKLYFDKETFRHVRSEYSRISSAGIGRTPDESARFNETRLKMTEEFSDFRQVDGLTLPFRHLMNYSTTGQNGTTEIEWTFNYTEFAFNQQLAPDTFGE